MEAGDEPVSDLNVCYWVENGRSEQNSYCGLRIGLLVLFLSSWSVTVRQIGLLGMVVAIYGATPLAAEHDTALTLPATEPWKVDFAEDSCAVQRLFGDTDNRVFLEFRSYSPDPSLTVRIVSDTLSYQPGTPRTQFLPAGEVQSHNHFRSFEVAGGWRGATFTEGRPQTEAPNKAYRVRSVFKKEIELTTNSMAQVLEVMRSCEDDLMRSLGLDAETNRSLSRELSLGWDESWLRVTAPMQRSFRKQGSSYQLVRLLVDEQGSVFDCHVVEGSTDPSISDRMCNALEREAEFDPALDSNSRPVKSYFMLTLSAVRR